jgi:NAD+ diphosphatase
VNIEQVERRGLAYSNRSLDRAAGLRADPLWIERTLATPQTVLIPLWRDACLVDVQHRPVVLPVAEAQDVLAAGQPVFLGLDGSAAVFAIDLSHLGETRALALAGAAAALDVRRLASRLSWSRAALIAYARGILYWHRNQGFCGACGSATVSRDGGHLRVCAGTGGCGKLLFPRIEPSIIVLVEAPGLPARCLLGRHRGAPAGMYSTLAGFVEIGESLEDAVYREVAEEAGVRLDTVTYATSQAWPFPAGLMVGFRAVAASDAIVVDRDELEEARWFTRVEVRELATARGESVVFNDDSIEKVLVDAWLREDDRFPER